MSENIRITVVNELDGKEYEIPAGQGQTVGQLVEAVYKKLKRTPSPNDRLYCQETKDSVLKHVALKLKDYMALGACSGLVWAFAGSPGGA